MRMDLSYTIPMGNELFFWDTGSAALNLPVVGSGGPVVESVAEQVTGRDTFSGRELFPSDATTGEELAARGKALGQTLVPAPSLLKYGVSRMYKANEGLSDEQLGYAILGAIGGVNIRSPHIKAEVVRKVVRNQIVEGDMGAARGLVDAYNRLKPGSAERITPSVVGSVIQAERGKAMDDAIKALRMKDRPEAQRIVDEFNADPQNARFGKLTLKEAEGRWKAEQARGRTR